VPPPWLDNEEEYGFRLKWEHVIPIPPNFSKRPTRSQYQDLCSNCFEPRHGFYEECRKYCVICIFRGRPNADTVRYHKRGSCDSSTHAANLCAKMLQTRQKALSGAAAKRREDEQASMADDDEYGSDANSRGAYAQNRDTHAQDRRSNDRRRGPDASNANHQRNSSVSTSRPMTSMKNQLSRGPSRAMPRDADSAFRAAYSDTSTASAKRKPVEEEEDDDWDYPMFHLTMGDGRALFENPDGTLTTWDGVPLHKRRRRHY
jgi:hypothetical protein